MPFQRKKVDENTDEDDEGENLSDRELDLFEIFQTPSVRSLRRNDYHDPADCDPVRYPWKGDIG